jgi:hypothetical protein
LQGPKLVQVEAAHLKEFLMETMKTSNLNYSLV